MKTEQIVSQQNIDTLKQKYELLIAEQKELAKKFQDQAQDLFKKTIAEFWELNPGVNAVVWHQYTPFWNDGDTCEFSVYSPTFTNATGDQLHYIKYGEFDPKEGEEDDTVWATDEIKYTMTGNSKWRIEEKQKILAGPHVNIDSCILLSEMLQSSEFENIMKMMFDDHVKVIATRDGFDVSEYEHD